jgi:hypothetical protein
MEGGVSCYFRIEGVQGTNPYRMIKCTGSVTSDALGHMKSTLSTLKTRSAEICGQEINQCPPNFLSGMVEYIGQHPTGWKNVDLHPTRFTGFYV